MGYKGEEGHTDTLNRLGKGTRLIRTTSKKGEKEKEPMTTTPLKEKPILATNLVHIHSYDWIFVE